MNNDYVTELEEQLEAAKKASMPVTVETIKEDHDEKVMVSSHGTTRRDLLGGKPAEYLQGHAPLAPAPRPVLPVITKEQGKLLKENEDERVSKLVSGTIRRDVKATQ